MRRYYLAIDMGASGGRHILGHIENGRLVEEEVYRFDNGMHDVNGQLCWDTDKTFAEIIHGMKKCKDIGKIPASLAIDTWGVDFCLIDSNGYIVGDAVGYRDARTDGVEEELATRVDYATRYERTGISNQPYNTLNQLYAIAKEYPEHFEKADCMLMTPNYYSYLLTGIKSQEYTMASTSQLINLSTGSWDGHIISKCGIPRRIFQDVKPAGYVVGELLPQIAEEVGYDCKVAMIGSHDTASAVLAMPTLKQPSLFISSGTWSLMGIETDQYINSNDAMKAGFTNEGGFGNRYTFIKNIMGLWMIQSVRKELAPEMSYKMICDGAAQESINSIVDCNDNCFLAPKSMVEQIREYCRDSQQEVPETIYQLASVVYNSLARCYAEAKNEIEELTGITFNNIHIIGGGSQADYLNRITAKYTGCKVIAGPAEATAIGNILGQMITDGIFRDIESARQCVVDSYELTEYAGE